MKKKKIKIKISPSLNTPSVCMHLEIDRLFPVNFINF